MITLPAHCSTKVAPGLLASFLDHADRGADLIVDGSAVDVVGQAVLQLLVCAKADADAAGRSFAIAPASDALVARAIGCKLGRQLGLDSIETDKEGPAHG
ncbi:STAS domain-containing protein [Sphingomonas sp. AP4-R1]|uniref:STAS domain-containing protein n=1 Tax=Sphingomonas sp. AP4-R1 TaxID=2735134 RepID=UPI001493B333|nr:STAS domain-containing protein [Sphingomonas sp. AP4-R1]QJU57457.1 STAS domain-containing protein [Sphingomonas sp. AP4-R1]